MPKRSRPPTPQIIEYKQLKTAAGGSGASGGGGSSGGTGASGGGGGSFYRPGQTVPSKVNYAERDGYAVTIGKDNLPGFIKTAIVLRPGDDVLGVFVCFHNGRILLSQLFSAPTSAKYQMQQNTVKWEEHLDNDVLDAAYEAQAAAAREKGLAKSDEEPPSAEE